MCDEFGDVHNNELLIITTAYLTTTNGVKDTINPLQLFIFTNVIHCSRLPL